MITIDIKTTDERQGIVHASGHIGKLRWVASYSDGWKVTIPAGCPSDNGIEMMALVIKRLKEAYPNG